MPMAREAETAPGRWHRIAVRAGDAIASACTAIAACALVAIVGINGVNVAARYLFGSPFSWAEELMLFLMILGVFAGGIAITWRNQHVRIATLVERAPPAVQGPAEALAIIACIAVLAVVTAASFNLVSLLHEFDQRSDALQAPMWIPQSFVTIGLGTMAALMALRLALSRFR